MVAGANNTPAAPPPVGANPVPDAGQGGGNGGKGTTLMQWEKGEPRAKFTGNTTEMKGHVFQPRNVSKNANQYHDTVEVLRQYVVKEYETGRELMALFLVTPMQPTVTKPPDDPTLTGRADNGTPKLATSDTKTFDLLIKWYLE